MRDLLNSRDHNLTAELAALLASELATNAVRHAQTSFVVRVRLDGNYVRLEVEDGGSDIARMPTNPSMDGAGRGLQLVAGLTRPPEFVCGDCELNAQCGLPPHEDCIEKAIQRERDPDGSILRAKREAQVRLRSTAPF